MAFTDRLRVLQPRLRLPAMGGLSDAAAALRGWVRAQGALFWTMVAIVVGVLLLAQLPRDKDQFALICAALIFVVGLAAGLRSYVAAVRTIKQEGRVAAVIQAFAKQELQVSVQPGPDGLVAELQVLQNSLRKTLDAGPTSGPVALDTRILVDSVFSEAKHRRFPAAADLVDQVEAARPELLRGLRLVQVQALRLGILGTFAGLLLGLTDVRTVANVDAMLDGLRTGFGTSIAGLIIACWAGFIGHDLADRQRGLRTALLKMLTDIVEVASRASQSDEFFREVPQVVAAMRELRDRVGSSLGESNRTLKDAAEAIGRGPQTWDAINQAMVQLQKAVIQASAGTTDAVRSSVGQVEAAVDHMRNAYTADTLRRIEDTALDRLTLIATQLQSGLEGVRTSSDTAMTAGSVRLETEFRTMRRDLHGAIRMVAALLGAVVLMVLIIGVGGVYLAVVNRGVLGW